MTEVTITKNRCCSDTTRWEGSSYYENASGRLVYDVTGLQHTATHTPACHARRAEQARKAREHHAQRAAEHAAAVLASPHSAAHRAWCDAMDTPVEGETPLDRLLRAHAAKMAALSG